MLDGNVDPLNGQQIQPLCLSVLMSGYLKNIIVHFRRISWTDPPKKSKILSWWFGSGLSKIKPLWLSAINVDLAERETCGGFFRARKTQPTRQQFKEEVEEQMSLGVTVSGSRMCTELLCALSITTVNCAHESEQQSTYRDKDWDKQTSERRSVRGYFPAFSLGLLASFSSKYCW